VIPLNSAAIADTDAPRWTDLVARLRAGQDEATEELYTQLHSLRFYFTRRLGYAASADAYHDLIVTLISQVRSGDLRDPEHLAAYARGIAANMIRNTYESGPKRFEQGWTAVQDYNVFDVGLDPEALAIRRQQIEVAARILNALPSRDRQVLVRFYLKREPATKIQEELALSETQFRLIKSRAKQRFAGMVKARMSYRPPIEA